MSLYPAAEGRFPQVSGLDFAFDPAREPGYRVRSVRVDGAPLRRDAHYRLATRHYMARGKDGFEPLLSTSSGGVCEELVSPDEGRKTYEIMLDYFEVLGSGSESGRGRGQQISLRRKRRSDTCSPAIGKENDDLLTVTSLPGLQRAASFDMMPTSGSTDSFSSASISNSVSYIHSGSHEYQRSSGASTPTSWNSTLESSSPNTSGESNPYEREFSSAFSVGGKDFVMADVSAQKKGKPALLAHVTISPRLEGRIVAILS